jgi:hypothetical protein
MIVDSFEPRTLANMEVALERACSRLAEGSEQHEFRSHIASSILACAQRGDITLGRLTYAAMATATRLSNYHHDRCERMRFAGFTGVPQASLPPRAHLSS